MEPHALTGALTGLLAAALAAPVLRAAATRHSVPSGEPPRACCPDCGRPLRLLPPTGRCPRCGVRLGPRPWAAELPAALVLPAVGAATAATPPAAALYWAAALGVALGLVDVAVHRLPDALTLPAFAGTAVLLTAAALADGRPAPLLRCLIAALLCGAVFWGMALVAPVGLGDAKLVPTLGALLGWYGWSAVLAGLVAAFVLAGLYGTVLLLTGRARRGDPLPLGPFLLLGTLAAVLSAG